MPVWWKSPDEAIERLGSFPVFEVRRFRHHLFLQAAVSPIFRSIRTFGFYISKGMEIHRKRPVTAIMCYGTNINGVAAVFLRYLTGARLIVEIPGVPHHAFVAEVEHPGWKEKLKKVFADILLNIAVRNSHRTKLLYPTQLEAYPALQKVPASIFHDFIPASALTTGETSDGKYLLTLGFPWYRKGLDVLVRAFSEVALEFPDYKLRVVAFLSDSERTMLEKLSGGNPQVQIERSVQYEEALALVRNCSIFVLASRSEAMGRVLLEAMAAKKPIIASNVTGIPFYARDEENALLFEVGNHKELAEKIRRLLNDPPLQSKLGKRGFEMLDAEFDEEAYSRHFAQMLADVSA